jgi:hypothetical protein
MNTYEERDRAGLSRRVSNLRTARILACLVFAGAATAALAGLFDRVSSWPGGGQGPVSLVNTWGEEARLEGRGLYARDGHSAAVQERAQDLVTLVFALPLLVAGLALTRRPSGASRLLLSGALGYFTYCYGMMAVGTAYNQLFLVYVGTFAAALFGLIFSLSALDADELAAAASARFPRRSAAVFCILVGLFLGLNWLGGIVLPSLLGGKAPAGLDASSTLFVQAFDLGILVPVACLSAFWLLRRDPRGYLLGSVLLVKGAAEGLAVAFMGFSMRADGIDAPLAMVLGFLALALGALVLGALALRSVGFKAEAGMGIGVAERATAG